MLDRSSSRGDRADFPNSLSLLGAENCLIYAYISQVSVGPFQRAESLVAVSLPTLMHIHATATACKGTLTRPEWNNSEHLLNEHHTDQPSLNYNLT
jgi:hypothetical protein